MTLGPGELDKAKVKFLMEGHKNRQDRLDEKFEQMTKFDIQDMMMELDILRNTSEVETKLTIEFLSGFRCPSCQVSGLESFQPRVSQDHKITHGILCGACGAEWKA